MGISCHKANILVFEFDLCYKVKPSRILRTFFKTLD